MIEPQTWPDFLAFINRQGFSWRDLLGQDKWDSSWTPSRTGWTDVGTPTVTARFRTVGRQCFFQVKVVPGTTVATVAGTSYIALPIPAVGAMGGCAEMHDLTTNVAVGVCVIDATNSRVYQPTRTALGDTFSICGWYEI